MTPRGVDEPLWFEARQAAGNEPSPVDGHSTKKYWGKVWSIYKAKAAKRGRPYKKMGDTALSLVALSSVNIIIEPYEPIIQKAIDAIEKKIPGYFSGIKKIVLESGDPGHFGKVESDKPDVIFVSLNKMKALMTGAADDEAIVNQVAETLAHEMGHIKSKFQGGEAPAEGEEHQMHDRLLNASLKRNFRAARYFRQIKSGAISAGDTVALSKSIIGIIDAFSSNVKPENRAKYISSMKLNIQKSVSPMALVGRKKNPGAGVGSAVSMIKNVLAGNSPDVIARTLALVLSGLGAI